MLKPVPTSKESTIVPAFDSYQETLVFTDPNKRGQLACRRSIIVEARDAATALKLRGDHVFASHTQSRDWARSDTCRVTFSGKSLWNCKFTVHVSNEHRIQIKPSLRSRASSSGSLPINCL